MLEFTVGLILGLVFGFVFGFFSAVYLTCRKDEAAVKQGVIKLRGRIFRLEEIQR